MPRYSHIQSSLRPSKISKHTSLSNTLSTFGLKSFTRVAPPLDIVEMIFHWASAADDLYLPEPKSFFDKGVESELSALKLGDRNDSFQSWRSVCKNWFEIADKYVLKSIFCSSSRVDVWRVLADRVGKTKDGELGLGRYVKRIYLSGSDESEEILQYAIDILESCPHTLYTRLHFTDTTYNLQRYHDRLVGASMSPSNKRLLHLDVDLGLDLNEGLVFTSLPLAACQNLQVLSITDAFGKAPVALEPLKLDMSKLHTLRMNSSMNNIIRLLGSCILSNLQHLHLFSVIEVDDALTFFTDYGGQLRSLEISVPFGSSEIGFLLRKCRKLEDIVFSMAGFMEHPPLTYPLIHNNVKRMGIRDILMPYTPLKDIEYVLRELMEKLADDGDFPSLSILRFLDLTPGKLAIFMGNPDFEYFWKNMLERLSDVDIRVEDYAGDLLTETANSYYF